MALAKRIFLFYFLFVALCGYFMLNMFSYQVYPSIKQVTEETLVDTANLLAETLSNDIYNDKLEKDFVQEHLVAYKERKLNAKIWGVDKKRSDLRVYVTDHQGIVIFDSSNKDVGQDYSQWRDVYLTLRGQYGARTTQENKAKQSTVMYVAAPIYKGNKIAGVVTVGKSTATVEPYVKYAESQLTYYGLILVVAGIAVGALLSWWLGASLKRLTQYAKEVSKGKRIKPPRFYGGELTQLAKALDIMRIELDGKNYVERYVHTLTHELKSPIAAIKGATELLQQGMTAEQQHYFLQNIESESKRLQQLIDRLLNLSMVEQKQSLEQTEAIVILPLIQTIISRKMAQIEQKQVHVVVDVERSLVLNSECFLLQQALLNIVDNALDFICDGGVLYIAVQKKKEAVILFFYNQGATIPEYALPRLCERFYSLPRPRTGRKSTGLGLNFVQEVMKLHEGKLVLSNQTDGVLVELVFPVSKNS